MAATFDNRMVDNGTRQATRLDAIQGRYDPWLLLIVIARFWIISVVLVLVGLATLKVR